MTVRNSLTIDGREFVLQADASLDDLRSQVEAAIHAGGRFVTLPAVGLRGVSVLITATTRAIATSEVIEEPVHELQHDEHRFGVPFEL